MNKCFIYLTFIDIHWFARILLNGYFIQMNIEYVIFLWGFEYHPSVAYLTDFDLDPRSISPREAGRCTFVPRYQGGKGNETINSPWSLISLRSLFMTHIEVTSEHMLRDKWDKILFGQSSQISKCEKLRIKGLM